MQMKRRQFLGFLGGAVAAGPTAAKTAASNSVLRQAGFAAGSEVASAAPAPIPAASAGVVSKAVRWIRLNGVPAWKMHDIVRQADYKRANGLDPDIACMVSVSAGWKARTQRKRNINREIEASLAGIGRSGARHAFEEKMQKRFGAFFDWYD